MTLLARAPMPAALRRFMRQAYYRVLGSAYRGHQVACPCCGGAFRTFLPFGSPPRDQARCPGCGALERHRLLWLFLERETNVLTAPLRLLHLAPEPLLERRLSTLPHLGYVSIDLDSPLARLRMDATRLGFRTGSFDVILCLHVLEHIPDDRAAMRELRRVLRPGGWAVLQSPFEPDRAHTFEDWRVTSPADRLRVFGQEDHVRIYGRDYLDRLREEGFEVRERRLADHLAPEDVGRFGIVPDEAITLCRPPEAGPGDRSAPGARG